MKREVEGDEEEAAAGSNFAGDCCFITAGGCLLLLRASERLLAICESDEREATRRRERWERREVGGLEKGERRGKQKEQ